MKTEIKVENLKSGEKAGAVCFADVTLIIVRDGKEPVDLVTIRSCQLRVGDKGDFLGLPQKQWTGNDGEKRYERVVEFPKHTYNAALEAVQNAWERYRPEPSPQSKPEGEFHDPFADR